MSTETKSTIAAKLVAAMKDIDAVTKRGKNEKYNYGYVKAADVANEVRAALGAHGIAFTYHVLGDERWEKPTASGGSINYCQVRIAVTFIDADSGSQLTTESVGCGQDVGEKAVYKAMTGALKYALRMNFLIPDELDPENEKAEVHAEVERQKAENARPPKPVSGVVQSTQADQSDVTKMTVAPTTLSTTGSFQSQAKASIALAEKRAAADRTKLAQEQGTFLLENGVLTAKVIGIENKQTRETPPKDYLRVTFNSRFVENGANHASCYDTELWDSVQGCLDNECQLKIEFSKDGKHAKVADVIATKPPFRTVEPLFEGA